MTAPMVDYKIHWLKMMSVTESRAVVGRHDGINGRDNENIVAICCEAWNDLVEQPWKIISIGTRKWAHGF